MRGNLMEKWRYRCEHRSGQVVASWRPESVSVARYSSNSHNATLDFRRWRSSVVFRRYCFKFLSVAFVDSVLRQELFVGIFSSKGFRHDLSSIAIRRHAFVGDGDKGVLMPAMRQCWRQPLPRAYYFYCNDMRCALPARR